MGIARRKAGAVVRCPKCAGEVIVPAAQEAQAAGAPGRLNQMFEAIDFGREFGDARPAPEPLPNPLMPPPPYDHPPLPETESQPSPQPVALPEEAPLSRSVNLNRAGLFLTVPTLMGAGAAMLLAIALTFLLGFFLGRAV